MMVRRFISYLLHVCFLALGMYLIMIHLHVHNFIATRGGALSEVGIKLRDRVLKEAKVLPNDIIDVSSFMDAYGEKM